MNAQQEKLRDLIIELLDAMKRGGDRQTGSVLKNLPGIENGSFFNLPFGIHTAKLGWLTGAYFGRGEGANRLLDQGFLREDFPMEFHRELSSYSHSQGEWKNPYQ
jgi:hypothetical protein